MTPEMKTAIDGMNTEFAALRQLLADQKGTINGDLEAKCKLINDRIDAFEVKLQRAIVAPAAKTEVKDPVRTKAFGTYLRKGAGALTPDEVKLMTLADDTTGGFGATEEFDSGVLKGITLISPVRQLVRVRTTGARAFKTMKRTGQFAARRVGDTAARTETTGLTYGLEEVPVAEMYAMVDIARVDLEDTFFDLEAELQTEFIEQFAKKEGTEFVTGTGANGQFEGIMTNAAVAEEVTGDANNLTYAGLVAVSHNGKAGYDWRFIFNRKTLGKIRLMVDGNGQPLWAPMAADAPSTVLGLPYTIVHDCEDVSAGTYPVACGDFKRAFVLGDRTQQRVVRDDLTQAENGAVRFYSYKRNGGQVVLSEAIRKLKISA